MAEHSKCNGATYWHYLSMDGIYSTVSMLPFSTESEVKLSLVGQGYSLTTWVNIFIIAMFKVLNRHHLDVLQYWP